MIPLGDALYVLTIIVVVLGFMHLHDAWKTVDWAQWWASTRTSERDDA